MHEGPSQFALLGSDDAWASAPSNAQLRIGTAQEFEKLNPPGGSSSPSPSSPSGGRFRYDPTKGTCVDAKGREGLNPPPSPDTLKDGKRPKAGLDLECADLKGFSFKDAFGLATTTYASWNLTGAAFPDGPLAFAKFASPDLRGARMGEALFQHSELVEAKIDAFTALPKNCPAASPDARAKPYSCRR